MPYASSYQRAVWVMAIFAVGLLMRLVMLACDYWQYQLMGPVLRNEAVTYEQLETGDNLLTLLSAAWLVWYPATVIAFLMWKHRAHRNLPSLGAGGLHFSPRGAVGWYFVPFLNLFKPYQVMREIYNASEPGDASEDRIDWHYRYAPAVVKTWWTLFLFMNLVGNAVARASFHADTPGAYQFVAAVSMVDDTLSIAAMLAAMWLVWSITKRQEDRAAALSFRFA